MTTATKNAIEKSIAISAPKETVWKVLLEDEYLRQWCAEFSLGSHAETDWQQGSKVIFKDDSGFGIIGRITENKPAEVISMTYNGVYGNGQEDYDSAHAKEVAGGTETYRLTNENGNTRLDICCDMGPQWFEQMAASWDRALIKIKQLAEGLK